jgi:AcrR family transcriptional regulator
MLVVGHPGHELRAHGWLEIARPVVMVLTDGSGHIGVSRLASTATVIDRAGASRGSVFGPFTDAALYRALVDHNLDLFTKIADELADVIVSHGICVVAGDDAEGYNPTHDICRLLIDAAVRQARSTRAATVSNLAFGLMNRPDDVTPAKHDGISRVHLDEAAFGRKLAAAAHYPEMAAEVAAARKAWGDDAFAVETFRHVPQDDVWAPGEEPPFYERHGERRVKDGLYEEVIRYDRHIRPLADALAARTNLLAQ